MRSFLDIAAGAEARRHQADAGVAERYAEIAARGGPDGLGPAEVQFLAARDSFYLASVTADGWPYVQHRGGPPGFVRVLGPMTIAWAEQQGNRQFLTAGNLDRDGRVALIAVDYAARRRLKLLGVARWHALPDAALRAQVGAGEGQPIVSVEVAAGDWNCAKHITPRYTAEQVEDVVRPLRERIAELERGDRRPSAGSGDAD